MKRLVLTMIALLGLLIVFGILFRHGRKSAALAQLGSPPVDPATPTSSDVLEVPDNGADTTTRESSPPTKLETSDARDATSVSGLVLDADTEVPIDRFEVVHSPTGAGGNYVDTLFGFELAEVHPSLAFAGTDGRFVLPDLGSDARNVAVVAPGYELAKIQVVEIEPNVVPDDLVFRMRRAATVRGRVIDPVSGAPVESALVAWIDDGGQARTGPKERFERTDALGRFVLDSVPAGPRRLLAGREDLGQAFTPPLELEPGVAAQEIVIELGRLVPK